MNALRSLLLATAAIAAACAPASGPSSHSCTDIGCADGVTVDLGALAARFPSALPLAIHLCVDAVCDDVVVTSASDCHRATTSGPAGAVPPLVINCFPGASGGIALQAEVTAGGLTNASHVVAVAIRGADGGALFTEARSFSPTESRPNGPSCEPLCRQGHVVMTP